MNKIFGTFKGFINNTNVKVKLKFGDLVNESGEDIDGEVYIENQMVIACMKLKFGDRYLIGYKDIVDGALTNINHTKKLRKVVKCDIFRRFKDEIHFVGGKYQGKKDSDLEPKEFSRYCIWLVRSSYNEVTIKTALQILKQLHDE
tara:strand:- start:76780 stop:77214 length:435 start_codon:yes stop_codon:yes gene_type:complete